MGGDDPDFDRLIAESRNTVDTEETHIDQNIVDHMISLGFDREKIIAVSDNLLNTIASMFEFS